MLRKLGVENRLDLFILISLFLLVAITPLGKEATNPIVMGLYRSLLIFMTITTAVRTRQFALPQISFAFLGLTAIVVVGMYASVVLRSGSHFDGVYNFYQNALFLAAFIGLASYQRTRTPGWKGTILGYIVVVDLEYLLAAWIHGTLPLLGPFVNPNYFASFLLVGFAICVVGALFARDTRVRVAAAIAGLLLLYGIGQTASRGVFLSVLVVLAVSLFRAAREYRIPWMRVALIGALLVVLTAAANPTLIRKFTDRGQHDVYNYERVQIWKETLSMIASHPILGVGLSR